MPEGAFTLDVGLDCVVGTAMFMLVNWVGCDSGESGIDGNESSVTSVWTSISGIEGKKKKEKKEKKREEHRAKMKRREGG